MAGAAMSSAGLCIARWPCHTHVCWKEIDPRAIRQVISDDRYLLDHALHPPQCDRFGISCSAVTQLLLAMSQNIVAGLEIDASLPERIGHRVPSCVHCLSALEVRHEGANVDPPDLVE